MTLQKLYNKYHQSRHDNTSSINNKNEKYKFNIHGTTNIEKTIKNKTEIRDHTRESVNKKQVSTLHSQ